MLATLLFSVLSSYAAGPHDAGNPRAGASACPLLPISSFRHCVETRTKSLDDLLPLLPNNKAGRGVCDTMNLLQASESLQNEDISAEHPGILCGNGEVFLRHTTKADGKHFNEVELLVRDGTQLVPIYVKYDKGAVTFAINPKIDDGHGGKKACTECHGRPPQLLWGEYPNWKNAFGAHADEIRAYPEQSHLEAFAKNFPQRPEKRFAPAIERMRSIPDTKIPPYRHFNDFEAGVHQYSPNTVLTQYAAQVNGRTLADALYVSDIFQPLTNTWVALSTPDCVSELKAEVDQLFPEMQKIATAWGLSPPERRSEELSAEDRKGEQWMIDSRVRYQREARAASMKKWAQELFAKAAGIESKTNFSYNTGLGGGKLYLDAYLSTQLVQRLSSSQPNLRPLLAKVVTNLPVEVPPAVKVKDDPHVWDSFNALGGYLDRDARQRVCQIALPHVRDELQRFAKRKPEEFRKPAGAPPALFAAQCVRCHQQEWARLLRNPRAEAWWLEEAKARVQSGDMPRGGQQIDEATRQRLADDLNGLLR